MRGEDQRRINRLKPGAALAVLCLNRLVTDVAMLATAGFKAPLQIPDARQSCCASRGARMNARTLTMRERALTKDAHLISA
jgi:hypothetical protein